MVSRNYKPKEMSLMMWLPTSESRDSKTPSNARRSRGRCRSLEPNFGHVGGFLCTIVQSIMLPLRSNEHGISQTTAHVLFRLQLAERYPMSQKVI